MERKYIDLTASEIAVLWSTYMNDSMSIHVLKHFMETAKDPEIITCIQQAYEISNEHLKFLTSLYEKEEYPLPYGFTDKDMNPQAPALFTDSFKLNYILQMSRVGSLSYSGGLSFSSREDIRNFYVQCSSQTIELYQNCTNLLLEKGLYIRRPYIPKPVQGQFVDSQDYLSGIKPFTKHRQLNVIEVSHLSMNIETNQIGAYLCMAFAQTAISKDVVKYMQKGKEISKKHIKVFADTLVNEDIQAPISADHAVLDSTTPIFSDKLMMFQMGLLSAAGMGNYATASAASQRTDIAANYQRLSIEIGNFAKDGADLMIKNKWFEQPPTTPDRDQLAQQ
jgi:hypothetical protein